MQEKQANALALAAAYYKDDLMQISIRLKAFRFHASTALTTIGTIYF